MDGRNVILHLCYMDSGPGVYLGVGLLKPKNEGHSDMDPSLDTGVGIHYLK